MEWKMKKKKNYAYILLYNKYLFYINFFLKTQTAEKACTLKKKKWNGRSKILCINISLTSTYFIFETLYFKFYID